MKELIPMDEMGVFADRKDTIRANSLMVAEMFGKNHDKVVRDIENLDCSKEFNIANYGVIKYKDSRGRKQKAYAMTRDGFVFLVMGYRGKKAAQFKEAYIKRFNEMEQTLKTIISARNDYPILTNYIASLHEHPQPYHFSNEIDMINRLVTGMSAKQFRLENNIPKGESIRPYLNKEQIELLDMLQKIDMGMLLTEPDYLQRKMRLEWYVQNMYTPKIAKMLK